MPRMPLSLGLDLGTTTITALALDVESGEIVGRHTVANDAEITGRERKASGWSEWDADRIASLALQALRTLAAALGPRVRGVAGIGLTGQQHGVVLTDDHVSPLGPLINWQDRRVEETNPLNGATWLEEIRSRAGSDSRERTGCTLSPGYMGATLFWLQANGFLPGRARACFLVDYIAALMLGERSLTDATSAASSGLFDVQSGVWDRPVIQALGLPVSLFADVGRAGESQGRLTKLAAEAAGLPSGIPVCVGLGDNQASVFGSVASLDDTILINVGTGGQVAAYSKRFVYAPNLETRPFPGGYLLVKAGLCGGRSYAVLEGFFRQVCTFLGGNSPDRPLFDAMNRLAATVPPESDGLGCQPLFTGTREDPALRGSLSGISNANFTPGHVIRALLEGMATIFYESYLAIAEALAAPRLQLVGAGNGLRQNPLLANIIAERFGVPMMLPSHCEEAAFGAALMAALGLGLLPNREAAGQLISYSVASSGDE